MQFQTRLRIRSHCASVCHSRQGRASQPGQQSGTDCGSGARAAVLCSARTKKRHAVSMRPGDQDFLNQARAGVRPCPTRALYLAVCPSGIVLCTFSVLRSIYFCLLHVLVRFLFHSQVEQKLKEAEQAFARLRPTPSACTCALLVVSARALCCPPLRCILFLTRRIPLAVLLALAPRLLGVSPRIAQAMAMRLSSTSTRTGCLTASPTGAWFASPSFRSRRAATVRERARARARVCVWFVTRCCSVLVSEVLPQQCVCAWVQTVGAAASWCAARVPARSACSSSKPCLLSVCGECIVLLAQMYVINAFLAIVYAR